MKQLPILAFALLFPVFVSAQNAPPVPPEPAPADEPPADEPPADEPPADEPPADEPPADEPPADTPPTGKKAPAEGMKKGQRKPARVLKVRLGKKPAAAGKPRRINVDVEGVPLAEVMDQIAKATGTNILTDPAIKEELTLSLRQIPWREAVEVMGKMTRCEVREAWPGVLVVEQPARLTTVFEDTPIRKACEQIADSAGLDVVVGPGVSGSVRLDVKELLGVEVLRLAAASAGAHAELRDGVVLISKAPLPPAAKAEHPLSGGTPGPFVNLEVEDAPLDEVVASLSGLTKQRLLCDSGIDQRLTLSLHSLDWRSALGALARASGTRVVQAPGGVLRLARVRRAPRLVTLDDVELSEAIRRLSTLCGLNLRPSPGLAGRVSVVCSREPLATLAALVRSSGLSLVREGSVVSVRPRGEEGEGEGDSGQGFKPSGKLVNLDFEKVPLSDAMDALGLKVERNILVSPDIDATLTCNLTQVDWRLALPAIADSLGCDVEVRPGEIYLFTQAPANRIQAKGAPLAPLLRALAARAGFNLVLAPGVEGLVELELQRIHWAEALSLVARSAGCKLIQGEGDVVLVIRDGLAPKPASSPKDRHYREALTPVLKRVEEAAFARDSSALARASADLRRAVEDARKAEVSTPPPGPVGPTAEALDRTEARLRRLKREIVSLGDSQDVEGMVKKFGALRGILGEPGAIELAKSVFSSRDLKRFGDLTLSIKLQIQIAEGNLLLERMAKGLETQRYADVLKAFEGVKELREDMIGSKREIFLRNAEALVLRAQTLAKQAARFQKLERKFGELRLQATLSEDGPLGKQMAVVGGRVLEEGDELGLDLSLRKVRPGQVELRYQDLVFTRQLR